jgi:hypothetical protein
MVRAANGDTGSTVTSLIMQLILDYADKIRVGLLTEGGDYL